MGDQVELQQQTRVLLLNGQTIILQGDVGDNSINEINTEILEQALQEAANNNVPESGDNQTSVAEQEQQHDNITSHSSTDPTNNQPLDNQQNEGNMEGTDESNNFVAIFENENGETQTVQLTLEQAAALGFQVENNTAEKEVLNSVTCINEVKDDTQYTGNQNETFSRLPQIPVTMSSQMMSSPRTTQQQNSTILGSLLKPPAQSMMSLVPQYVGNASTMSFAVKLQDSVPVNTSNSNLQDILIPTSSAVIPQNTINNANHSYTQQHTIAMTTQPGSSLLNQKLNLPVAHKNIGVNRQPNRSIVRLKPQFSNAVSPAILRPPMSKTVIPKIQGTPTSISNLAMTSATPISSTASMVRVLNNPSTNSSPLPANTKPLTSTAITTTPVQSMDKNSVPLAVTNASKPLGSSENPIQLVQHGQTFHSMQPLSQEQLKQIATVLQQKQLDTSRNSKNVLFDANTNTRIIYRVVYPEDLALKKPSSGVAPTSSANIKGAGRGGGGGAGKKGRPPKAVPKNLFLKKSNSEDDDDHMMLDPDLSKGEKEERKKVLPRTRSGRLSRPPRHMVKDYKRIHHLDFAEPDLDDSDGGYSDYRISDSELLPDLALEALQVDRLPLNQGIIPNNTTGLGTVKRAIHSKFRCPTCQKMYLGYRRLARHFDAFPDHGSMENVSKNSTPTAGGQEETPESLNGSGIIRPIVSSNRGGRGKRRGNPFFLNPVERHERRKAKLREFLSGYEPSVVAEVAGPFVAQSLNAWELMLLRISTSEDEPSRSAALLSEMSVLLGKVRSNISDVLTPYSEHTELSSKVRKIEIKDEVVAAALNVPCGSYNILESDDHKLQWCPPSLVEASSSTQISQMSHEIDAPTNLDLEEPQSKKQKLWDQNDEDMNKCEDAPSDKSFLDSTNDSEKPSDTSMCSDTPLDDIVKAELKNLANKSGLDDFVAPPPPAPTSNDLSQASEVNFVDTSYPNSVSSNNSSHFPNDISMDSPSTSAETSVVQSDSTPPTSVPSKHSDNTMSFQLATSSRLDLSEGSIDVSLDSHLEESTHTIDFEAFSEDFHTNTQS